MIELEKDKEQDVHKAVIVGISTIDSPAGEAHEHLDELAELVFNLGIEVLDRIVVPVHTPHVQYYIGSGKVEMIAERARELGASLIVCDIELSPSQQRNWEKSTKLAVIDREEVILDIFAERAQTKEAVLQVELARLQYSLPRLTRAWTHLSRQKGGAKGTRGEGEKQIEVDRRMVSARIASLKKELATVRKQRETQRKSRDRNEMAHAAIVGYTNAGKSSLLNRLTGAQVLVEDKLFATLDPTTRRMELPSKEQLLLTDTVGFVRKLPHSLVEAFKSTLEEAVLADFLVLVLDLSSPRVEEHWETTFSVLRELGAEEKDIVVVFNKMDVADNAILHARARSLFPDSVFVSVRSGEGLDELRQQLAVKAGAKRTVLHMKLPPERHDLAALAHAKGQVYESEYDDEGNLILTISISSKLKSNFERYVQKNPR